MMEEVHSVFAVGAGAVTKLVSAYSTDEDKKITRIFAPKYPYEYLRDYENRKNGENEGKKSRREQIAVFFDNYYKK
jgi:hypothetical protein